MRWIQGTAKSPSITGQTMPDNELIDRARIRPTLLTAVLDGANVKL
jgi:hypothetical protein